MSYRGATRDSIAGRRMLAAVESVQGPKGEGRCAWTGCDQAWDQVDHVIARALGGGDEPDNLQGLCAFHNASKGDGTTRQRPAGSSSAAPVADGTGQASRVWLST